MPGDPVDTSVLRESRQACDQVSIKLSAQNTKLCTLSTAASKLQAKDIYFVCLDKHLPSIKAEGPAVPRACKQQRLAFEAACKSSWVSELHLTLLQTERVRVHPRLQACGHLSMPLMLFCR